MGAGAHLAAGATERRDGGGTVPRLLGVRAGELGARERGGAGRETAGGGGERNAGGVKQVTRNGPRTANLVARLYDTIKRDYLSNVGHAGWHT